MRCPWCQEEYALVEALDQVPPALVVVRDVWGGAVVDAAPTPVAVTPAPVAEIDFDDVSEVPLVMDEAVEPVGESESPWDQQMSPEAEAELAELDDFDVTPGVEAAELAPDEIVAEALPEEVEEASAPSFSFDGPAAEGSSKPATTIRSSATEKEGQPNSVDRLDLDRWLAGLSHRPGHPLVFTR